MGVATRIEACAKMRAADGLWRGSGMWEARPLGSLYQAEDADSPDIWFLVSLFRTSEGAALAVRSPHLAEIVGPRHPARQIQISGLASDMVAFEVEGGTGAGEVASKGFIVWQRGRVVFSLSATSDSDAATDVLLQPLVASAVAAAAHGDAQPVPPASLGPRASYLPSESAVLDLLFELQQRMLPDDAFDGLEAEGELSTNLPALMHETPFAEEPISNIGYFKDRALGAERYIMGLSKAFHTPRAVANPPGTTYPNVITGYYVYADAAGASEALNASTAEYGLKLYNENPDLPSAPRLEQVPSPITVGEQSLAFRALWDRQGVAIETTMLRWRRGAVEL